MVILSAPPGSGKTTAIPLALQAESWLGNKHIAMLEPRRIAASGAASYMAQQLGEELGKTVGYQVRHEKRLTTHTKIQLLTEGLLTRRLQSDPELSQTGLVIFDEFHERHLQTDLALALCVDCQQGLRDDLKILIMSATLDIAGLQKKFPDAPVVQAEGRSFPVELHWGQRCEKRDIASATARTVSKALAEQSGDILVFLPGRAEIERCHQNLTERLPSNTQLLRLSGDTPLNQQQAALKQQAYRRVILSTALAESSVTVEGITTVVDCGWSRLPSFDANRGFTQLHTLRTSRASAEQRAGRAGRLGPGHCYRLWSEHEQQALAAQHAPEILEADLCPLLLELALWGVNTFDDLCWLDRPPQGHIDQATDLLQRLDALDAKGRITPHGKQLMRFGLHPRLANMLIHSQAEPELATLACRIAAEINDGRSRDSDLEQQINAPPSSLVKRGEKQLRQQLNLASSARIDLNADQVGECLAHAFPDRIAQQQGRRGEQVSYKLSNGSQAFLPQDEGLARQTWLVVSEVQPTRLGNRIRSAASISQARLESLFAEQLKPQPVVSWDKQQQCVVNETQVRLGELILSRKPGQGSSDTVTALCDGIRQNGLQCLSWDKQTSSLLARLQWLQAQQEGWPDFSDAALLDDLEGWLGPWLSNKTRIKQLGDLPLKDALLNRLGYERQSQLDKLAPSHITVPTGSNIRIDYSRDIPTLAVRVQEMFGASETPSLLNGQLAVKLELLSPGHRPLAVTQDLPSFWQNAWPEVKKEMKGRYPRHVWPDDPATAEPTARTKKGTLIRPR